MGAAWPRGLPVSQKAQREGGTQRGAGVKGVDVCAGVCAGAGGWCDIYAKLTVELTGFDVSLSVL